jgi:lipopolysaccharide transport protein LptA
MASSFRNCGFVLSVLAAAALPVRAAEPRASQPVSVEAESSDVDYRSSRVVFNRVRITQGDLVVEAERAVATGLDFRASRWQFAGQVRISGFEGRLRSDSAVVTFRDNRVARAEIAGTPAEFAGTGDGRIAHGRAGQIVYDVTAGTVRLSGDAWLSDGRNDITGETLVYSMREKRVMATSDEQGNARVHITINPQSPPGKPAP